MFSENFLKFRKMQVGLLKLVIFTLLIVSESAAQSSIASQNMQSDSFWWTIFLSILVCCLILAIFYRYKTKNAEEVSTTPYKRVSYTPGKTENGAVDADKELEWLRKNRKLVGKTKKQSESNPTEQKSIPTKSYPTHIDEIDENTQILPIFAFQRLKPTKKFDALQVSNDEALMSAIEQVQEEYEDDEEIRSLSVRILAAFRTSNSIEALSQVALYDLSSNLRSKAVTTLSEFDHESVFETILLACADPTREVRAAAARALFHLTFNRADAWVRIANSGEEGKMVQMARAAIEADLVERSFERLAHKDSQYAYEAFALVILLIRTGEMELITNYLQRNTDVKVRRALLHAIKVSKDKKGLDGLIALLAQKTLSPELQEDVDKTIEEMGFVTV